MGRGQASARGNNLLYGETRKLRSSAPTQAELDQTLMRITYQVQGDEFWDDTITPHDIRRKYSRYDETTRQQEVHLQRIVAKFRTLEADGMIELADDGEDPAWHSYRLTTKGRELGTSLVEEDHEAAVARIDEMAKGTTPSPAAPFDEEATAELRSRAEKRGPEGVTAL